MSFRLGNIEVDVPEPEEFEPVMGDEPPDTLLRAERAFSRFPTPENFQELLSARILNATFGADLDRAALSRLAVLLKARGFEPLPESKNDDPVGVQMRRVRQAKTDKGRERAARGMGEARVEIAIRQAREQGLELAWRKRVAEDLLRTVT